MALLSRKVLGKGRDTRVFVDHLLDFVLDNLVLLVKDLVGVLVQVLFGMVEDGGLVRSYCCRI